MDVLQEIYAGAETPFQEDNSGDGQLPSGSDITPTEDILTPPTDETEKPIEEIITPAPETEPAPEETAPVELVIISENATPEPVKEEEDTALPYQITVESPEYTLSSNVTVSVNTESVSLDALIEAISNNSVSLNVSNNSTSINTIQVLSINETPWFEKPFSEYTTTEGILFTMLLSMVLGYIFQRLARGININDL